MGKPHRIGIVASWGNWRQHPGPCLVHGQAYRYSFFRGGGLGGRPRTPHSTPPWGRSSRSKAGKRREPQDRYFEEIDSDDDDGQGVALAGNGLSDELNFTGADLGPHTRSRRKHEHGYDSSSSEGSGPNEECLASTMQVALRNKEDLLVQHALERIRRAQLLGKRNVKSTQSEIDALARKQRQEEDKRSRQKAKQRQSSSQLQLGSKDSKPARRKSSVLSQSGERTYNSEGRGSIPPGIIVPGPDGRLTQTPIGYYPPPSNPPSGSQSGSRDSRSGSRSGSSANLQQSTPPLASGQYWSGKPRYPSESDYVIPSQTARTSPTMRRLPDDPQWNPRPRSASSNYQYPPDAYHRTLYPSPSPISSQYNQGRRIVSGPTETRYPSRSRRPVPIPATHAASSDPTLPRTARHGEPHEEQTVSSEETDDDDSEYGVQVDLPATEYGYEGRRVVELRPEPRLGVRARQPQR